MFLFRSVGEPQKIGAGVGGAVGLAEPRPHGQGDHCDHHKTEKPESDHGGMPVSIRSEQKAAEDGARKRADAEEDIHRADGGGAVADKIVGGDGDHHR